MQLWRCCFVGFLLWRCCLATVGCVVARVRSVLRVPLESSQSAGSFIDIIWLLGPLLECTGQPQEWGADGTKQKGVLNGATLKRWLFAVVCINAESPEEFTSCPKVSRPLRSFKKKKNILCKRYGLFWTAREVGEAHLVLCTATGSQPDVQSSASTQIRQAARYTAREVEEETQEPETQSRS